MSDGLTSRQEFAFLAGLVMRHRSGEHATVTLQDVRSGTTRVAGNRVIQNVETRKVSLRVQVAVGRRQGSATTADLTAGAVRDAITRAERIARLLPDDPEYVSPLGPQHYLDVPTASPSTVVAGPARRLDEAARAIALCCQVGVSGAGIVSSSEAAVGVATSAGGQAYERRTEARFSLTAAAGESTGWAAGAHRSIDRLDVEARTRRAIAMARTTSPPRELPPGRYTVVLEPAAVAGLLSALLWHLDAKAVLKGTSPLNGRLGQQVLDARLSIANRPMHPDLLGSSFAADGLPQRDTMWIENGRLMQLAYDRYTAMAQGVEPMPVPDAVYVSSREAVEDLIGSTERGILVSNFWYIRVVNPTDLTVTGMTRDGTFLIEQGRVTAPLKQFRFHESPLRAFSQVEACTAPAEAITSETGKVLVPSMRIRDFPFSSVTKF